MAGEEISKSQVGVDATTLIVISTLVQTIVITVTLLVFILQFRGQEKAIKESSYQGLMGRYNDFISMLVDRPELTKLLMDHMPGEKPENISKEDAAVFSHLLVAYRIIEEAYLLYRKKWIDEENWQQWSAWLEALKTPLVHTDERSHSRNIRQGIRGSRSE